MLKISEAKLTSDNFQNKGLLRICVQIQLE